jgi:cyclophilin family peptidyl-prolyl cis-trans isomerase
MSIRAAHRHGVVCQAVLESLETRTLLTNTAPVLDPIPAVAMVAPTATTQLPKTIQVPLTATDADGNALTYTVTSSNSDIVPIMHASDPFLKMTVQFGAGVQEVQTLTAAAVATAGTYTLSFDGNTTTALAFNASVADVQAALQLLPGLSSVVVSGNPLSVAGGMIFTFPASMGNVDMLTIGATAMTPTTGYTVAETTRGIVPGATGDMYLLLYKDWAPFTVQTITGFLDAGFYNNLTFHRVLKGFMAQGGDPAGDGTGGPGFQFKDEFNQNLIFSNRGQLAMANSGADTNGSQFFITDAPYRSGDFTYTIWGQLVRGFDTYDGIVDSPVTDSTNGTPTPAGSLKILSASIAPDLTDTAITLSARKAGTATITVTVNDGHGGTDVKTFTVTATADTTNDPPIMKNLTDLYTPVNQPITIPLAATDLEHDALSFDAAVTDSPAHATLIKSGSTVTVVPDEGYTGVINLIAGVSRSSSFDTERITISVGGKPIHAKALGFSAVAGAARTAYVTTFTCDDTTLGAGSFTATINWGDGTTPLGTGDIVKSGSLYYVTGTHTYVNPGEYPLTVTVTQSALALQTGSVTSVRTLAEVAAAPQAAATATIINAGVPVVARQNVSFWQWGSVASTAATLSATVNWGDGTAAAALKLNANRNFQLVHIYKKTGKFNITITVNDGSGTPAVQRLLATVLAAGPKAVVSGDKSGITGQTRSFNLSPSDAGSSIPAGNYWYSINWGDGTATQTTTIGTAGLAHQYWKTGTFNTTVRIYDAWGDTGAVVTYPVTIANAMLEPDPFNTKNKALFIGGTQGNDKINVGIGTTGIAVTVNGNAVGQFLPTGFLYIWGYDGNDNIAVNSRLQSITSMYGGAGNDTLTGGAGYTILVGGDGNDTLKGGANRSILIGGAGTDRLVGQGNDDVLVGGTTNWDNSPVALIYLLAEWVQSTAYATRVSHLSGTTGGQNAGVYLEDYTDNTSTLQQTVFDDGVPDTLTGGAGNDWFVANQTTVVADAAKKDVITDATTTETAQILNVLT